MNANDPHTKDAPMPDDPRPPPTLPAFMDCVERIRQSIPGADPSIWNAATWAKLYKGYVHLAGLLGAETVELRETVERLNTMVADSVKREDETRASLADANRRLDAMGELIKGLDDKLDKARKAFADMKKKDSEPTKGK